MKTKIGVIGHNGVVGGAIFKALKADYGLSLNEGSYTEMAKADIVFVAAPTPQAEDTSVDMSIINEVISKLHEHQIKKQIVVIKSTVLPGTNAKLSEKYPSFDFVSSPEFLTEANPLQDFLSPDRVVIGTDNEKIFSIIKKIYAPVLLSGNTTCIFCSPIEAELIKYLANSFLAMKVIFANEAKGVCDLVGADYGTVRLGMALDSRIGFSHLKVSKEGGFGGMCFPKDTSGFLSFSRTIGADCSLIEATVKKNRKIRNAD